MKVIEKHEAKLASIISGLLDAAEDLRALADELKQGDTTGHNTVAHVTDSLSDIETELIEIEWVDA